MRYPTWTLIVLMTVGLAVPAAASPPAEVIETFLNAYRDADVDGMLASYAADATFTDVSQRHEVNGRPELQEMLTRLVGMHKEMDVEIKRRATTGNLVTVEVVYSGTLDCAALGLPDREDLSYSLPAVLLFEVDGNHIRTQTDYLDFRTFTETFASLQQPQ